MKKRNVFIILTEDICANFGCYGDVNAKTPNIDRFAKENIRFSYCSSAAPICSAARTSLNLGMYGSTAGVGQHRSYSPIPDKLKTFGYYMKKAGYTTAIGKTDFNFPLGDDYDMHIKSMTADSDKFAQTFADVIESTDKPIFMLQSTLTTHQSQYGYTEDTEAHRSTMPRLQPEEMQDRDNVTVPPYHFDTPEAREIWGQYHEKIATMDRMFGEAIDTLKKYDKYEDSIIIFAGDNGHGIPMGKVWLWDEGVHVPMIVHLPKDLEQELVVQEDEHGRYTERLTSFVDLLPTVLSAIGEDVPAYLQGKAFLGSNRVALPEEVYSFSERADEIFENCRAIREGDKLYTCDFAYSPYQHLNIYQTKQAPWFVCSMIERGDAEQISDVDRRALCRAIPRVSQQMFDMKNDKAQLHNLVGEDSAETARMRTKLLSYIINLRDGVFMPEPLVHEISARTGLTAYEIFADDTLYPVEKLAKLWEVSVTTGELPTTAENPCEKLMIIKNSADKGDMGTVKCYANDESEVVRMYSAFKLGDNDGIKNIIKTTRNYTLLLYIADIITHSEKTFAKEVLQMMTEILLADEFDVDERYKAAFEATVNILSIRLRVAPPQALASGKVSDSDYKNCTMVVDSLDRIAR